MIFNTTGYTKLRAAFSYISISCTKIKKSLECLSKLICNKARSY
jgi:hypothetical protein